MGDHDIHHKGKSGLADFRYMLQSTVLGHPRRAEGVIIAGPDKKHVNIHGSQPWSKTKETTTTVLGRTGGGTEGGTVHQRNVQDIKRSDPGKGGRGGGQYPLQYLTSWSTHW